MLKRIFLVVSLFLVPLFILQGCYTLNQVGTATNTGIEMTNAKSATPATNFSRTKKVNHFLWGLVSPDDAGIETMVSNAVAQAGGTRAVNVKISYQMTFVDGLIGAITFGIYDPFTLTVTGDVVK